MVNSAHQPGPAKLKRVALCKAPRSLQTRTAEDQNFLSPDWTSRGLSIHLLLPVLFLKISENVALACPWQQGMRTGKLDGSSVLGFCEHKEGNPALKKDHASVCPKGMSLMPQSCESLSKIGF